MVWYRRAGAKLLTRQRRRLVPHRLTTPHRAKLSSAYPAGNPLDRPNLSLFFCANENDGESEGKARSIDRAPCYYTILAAACGIISSSLPSIQKSPEGRVLVS